MYKPLLIVCTCLALASCTKPGMEPVTISVSDSVPDTKLIFNEESKYLHPSREGEAIVHLKVELKEELNKRRFTLVEDDADYTITLRTLNMTETVKCDMSEIETATTFTLFNNREDIPSEVEITSHVCESEDDDGFMNTISVEHALRWHSKTTRKKLKKKIKRLQE